MLGAADRIHPHVGRQHDVGRGDPVARPVGGHQRNRLEIRLVAAVGVHDLWAGACSLAAREDAVGDAGERVGAHFVGEGELHLGAEVPLIAAPGGVGIAKAVVGGDRMRAGDMRAHAVEHDVSVFVGIEAPVQESLQVAAALGIAAPERVLDRLAHGILRGSVVLEERDQVAGRGEAKGQHDRIFRRIDKLERRSLVIGCQERIRAIDPDRRVVDVGPDRGRYRHAIDVRPADELGMVVHHHVGLALIETGCPVRQCDIGTVRIVEDLLDDHFLDDRAAAGVAGDRQRRGERIGARADDCRVFPPRPYDGIAAPHQQAGARPSRVGIGDIRGGGGLIEGGV